MSGHPAEFPDHFWQHVEQPLRNMCLAQARCVAALVETYSSAYHATISFVRNRGAGFLTEDDWDLLVDWIHSRLARDIAEAEAEGWSTWLADNHIVGGLVP